MVKNPPANAGDARVRCLGWEDPLVNGMAIHSSILAWRVPWTEEPGGLQSMRSPRVSHTHTHQRSPNAMDRGAWRTTVPGITKSQSDGQRETDTLPPKRAQSWLFCAFAFRGGCWEQTLQRSGAVRPGELGITSQSEKKGSCFGCSEELDRIAFRVGQVRKPPSRRARGRSRASETPTPCA